MVDSKAFEFARMEKETRAIWQHHRASGAQL